MVWIIEVVRPLNYKAIRQVLACATLWRINNPYRKIVKATMAEYVDKRTLRSSQDP